MIQIMRLFAVANRTLLRLVVLVCAEVFEKVIDPTRRHGSDAEDMSFRVERRENLRGTLEIMVGVGEVKQFEAGERGEDSAISTQEALETAGGESIFA